MLDDNPLYRGETYRLRFKFSSTYPIGTSPTGHLSPSKPNLDGGALSVTRPSAEAPEVTFVKTADRPIPMHPHIYSNGIICLDLLGSQGWSPVQNVETVCMSIQSMLTGNHKNERPPGDDEFVKRNVLSPRNINFFYDDNDV